MNDDMNKKINRIIVLVDLSNGAEHLVDFCCNLADRINAKILFVHQVIGMFPAMTMQEDRDKIYQNEISDAQQRLNALVKGRVYGRESFIINEKPILATLSEIQSSYYTDWVVGGMKESSLMKKLLLGSTLIKVINNTNLLTIAVPITFAITFPQKILIAVTHKFAINEPVLTKVLAAFEAKITDIEFFSILIDEEEEEIATKNLLQLQQKYAMYQPQMRLLKKADKFTELKKHIANSGQAFLILQEGSRSLVDELLRKYLINEIIYSGNIPLIVLPNE